jgi:hypothetical protein
VDVVVVAFTVAVAVEVAAVDVAAGVVVEGFAVDDPEFALLVADPEFALLDDCPELELLGGEVLIVALKTDESSNIAIITI